MDKILSTALKRIAKDAGRSSKYRELKQACVEAMEAMATRAKAGPAQVMPRAAASFSASCLRSDADGYIAREQRANAARPARASVG